MREMVGKLAQFLRDESTGGRKDVESKREKKASISGILDSGELDNFSATDMEMIWENKETFENKFPSLGLFSREHKTAGYDCHSFGFKMLEECGLKYPLFNDKDVIKYTQFPELPAGSADKWNGWLGPSVDEALERKEVALGKKKFMDFVGKFSAEFFNQSKRDHLAVQSKLKYYSVRDLEDDAVAHRVYEETQQSNREVLQDLSGLLKQENRFPRTVMVIVDIPPGEVMDRHSSTILGPTKEGDDFWVVERSEIGSSVEIRLLSRMINNYNIFDIGLSGHPQETKINFALVKDEQAVLDNINS